MKSFVVAIFFACFVGAFGEKARFDNYRVYSANVENAEQLKALNELEAYPDGIQFLESPTGVGQVADLLVPPHKFADLAELFESVGIKNRIKTQNVQELIDEEEEEPLITRSFGGWDDLFGGWDNGGYGQNEGFGWNKYHNLNSIYNWLDQLLQQYPNVLTNYVYGRSYEGRPLRAVKVSHKKGNPLIFIEANIHAREWISAATATYFLNELLTSNRPEIRYLADNYDWVIVPVTNVDGYEYTHTSNRMWRKTRKPTPRRGCIGADPNRNFDAHHGVVGASPNPCSDTYPGPYAFSEPCTKALSEFIKNFNVKIYLAFHSYSQLLLFPSGHSTSRVRNYNDLMQIGLKAADAISRRYGTKYVVGNSAAVLYPASGGSDDWVYSKQNVPVTYTFEFRDKGNYGFLLPPNQIVPNALEAIDGIVALVQEAKKLRYV